MDQFRLGLNSFKKIKEHHTGSPTRAGAHGNSNYLNRKKLLTCKGHIAQICKREKKGKVISKRKILTRTPDETRRRIFTCTLSLGPIEYMGIGEKK